MSNERIGRVSARDGAEIDYTLHASGRPGAPKVALIHSLALDRTVWDGVVEQLRGDADIVTYDCRGHGSSAKSAGPYTTALFADDLADLLTGVGWDRAIIGGGSMGGTVALQFAAAYPQRVSGLALVDTTAWYGADASRSWSERAQKARTEGLGGLIEFQLTRWFGDAFREARPEIVERTKAIFIANDIDAYAASCVMLGRADLRSALPAMTMPVQVLVGDEDYATPVAMAQELERALPSAQLTVVQHARHLTMIEVPERVAAILRTLISKTEGSAVADAR